MKQDMQHWTQDLETENKLKQDMRDKIEQCLLKAQKELQAIIEEQKEEGPENKIEAPKKVEPVIGWQIRQAPQYRYTLKKLHAWGDRNNKIDF